MVISRIRKIDPDNASKIMGNILIQHHGENQIIRLASGPDNLLASVVKQAQDFLGISSNTWSPSASFHDRPSYASVVKGFGEVQTECSGTHAATPDHQFSFLDDSTTSDAIVSRGGWSESVQFPYSNTATDHWSLGWIARGFCKNGSDDMCLGSSSPTSILGSPFNRCFNFLNETTPRSPSAAAAALMMGEDIHKVSEFRPRLDRHDLASAAMGLGTSSSRQIYLTFPADSTFKKEDVSNYFSIFGPVQDVRIPCQRERMFGFVTFVLPETVKAILAKGNPHFVCGSRVLVKPYKEKGTISDKKHHHQHQIERDNFSALEFAERFNHIPFGPRMFNHGMMVRKKLEGRAELQQAIEFQERNLMNMQLTGHPQTNQSLVQHDSVNVVLGEEVTCSCLQEHTDSCEPNLPQVKDDDSGKESSDLNEHQSISDHIRLENLFASPPKTASDSHLSIFSANLSEADGPANVNQTAAFATDVN